MSNITVALCMFFAAYVMFLIGGLPLVLAVVVAGWAGIWLYLWIQSSFEGTLRENEPRDRPGSFDAPHGRHLGKLYPRAVDGRYQVVRYERGNPYGLQALTADGWVDVMTYERGEWRRLSAVCMWRPEQLEVLVRQINGEPERVTPVTEVR